MEAAKPLDKSFSNSAPIVASLEHLTGPSRGTVSWLGDSSLEVVLSSDCICQVAAATPDRSDPNVVAHLHRLGDGYEIETVEGKHIWVNGQPTTSKRLDHLDMIEFCENGPMSRYFVHHNGWLAQQSVSDIFSDARAYFRNSRQSMGKRIANTVIQIFYRLARETTIFFRISVILALATLAGLAYQQNRLNALLQRQIESGTARLESFSSTLARARKEALTPGDLETLRQELGSRMETTAGRILELERLSKASARVIADSRSSVVLLQGAYGFRETATGRMLRQVTGDDGQPLHLPNGLPMLSLEGKGQIAERQFIGTGFRVDDDGYLVTNRHVGLPWEFDASVKALAEHGLEPVLIKFIAYLPGAREAEAVELVKASEDADVAILRYTLGGKRAKGLRLAEETPEPGDEVIVMGYPTGLRSILAQAGAAIVRELQKSKDTGFWSVAERLSKSELIAPLASRGIVGRVSEETIVYDAETTHGGSGGPVLNKNGAVVAVNAAILPEYGGSNLGVPVDKVRELLGTVRSQ